MEKFKELTLRKPNEIIEVINRPLSTMSWNAYNFILTKLQEKRTNQIIISPAEILTAIGATNLHEELYKCLDELQKTQVSSIDKKGKLWGGFVLLSAFKKNDKGLYIEIPQLIADRMFKNEDLYYTTIKLIEQKAFKCSYSLVFYEIFKKFEKVSVPGYSLDILRQMTKTEKKYKVYADFKKRVLIPALKEINNFNKDFEYYFEEIYTGRKVTDIQFFKKIKDIIEDAEIVEDTSMSEKLLNAIKKAKKSLYVQNVYSQKAMDKLIKKYDEKLIIKALKELANYNQEIKSFSAIMTAKIEDIKNSSNKAIEEKIDKVTTTAPKRKKKEITEDNIADIFENNEEIEKLKKLLSKQAKEQGKFNDISSSLIKACRTREDIEMVANNLKIELNLELF